MKWQVIKIRIQKVLGYTITAFLFFVISAFLILQIPPVQNYFIGKFLKNYTNISGFNTTVKIFGINRSILETCMDLYLVDKVVEIEHPVEGKNDRV